MVLSPRLAIAVVRVWETLWSSLLLPFAIIGNKVFVFLNGLRLLAFSG